MLWFERPFLAVLRREFNASMRLQEDESASELPAAPPQPCHLYVHVPFCDVLCPFCSFHRVRYQAAKTQRYFAALRAEIRLYHGAGFRFDDVYIGGGTPTVDSAELLATLELLRSLWPIGTISVETNPNHLEPAGLRCLRDAGVTRLSVGVQTFDDGLLEGMERLQKYGTGAQIRQRLAESRGVFPTLNVDMIFNLPEQSPDMLDRDLSTLLELDVDQVSFYPLMTAPSARLRMEKSMGHSDPDLRHAMYERVLDRLLGRYHSASAWCFSREAGMYDEYITNREDYVGVGSGAFGYVGGTMYATTFSLNHYCRSAEAGRSGITQRRTLSARERMRYDYLMRLFGGSMSREYIERRHGAAFYRLLAPELLAMRAIGATRHDAQAIRLTRRGMYCWVLMMSGFFNAVNGVREQMRAHIRAELEAWNEEAAQEGVVAVPLAALGRMPRRSVS